MKIFIYSIVIFLTSIALFGGGEANSDEPAEKKAPSNEARTSKARAKGVNISNSEMFGLPPNSTESFQLILSRALQKEIDLTDRQASRINSLLVKNMDQNARSNMALRNAGSPEERAVAQHRLQAMSEALEQAMSTILTSKQVKRINEIAIQNAGRKAYLLPDVIHALALTDEQIFAIRLIIQQLAAEDGKARRIHFENSPKEPVPLSDRTRIEKNMRTRRNYEKARSQLESRADREIGRVLTRGQIVAFRRLRGVPFDVNKYRGTDAEYPIRRASKPRSPWALPPTDGRNRPGILARSS